MRVVDTVLFDLDDTLHDDTAAYQTAARHVAETLAAPQGADPRAVFDAYVNEASAFWKALGPEHLSAGILDTRAQMWDAALRAAGISDASLAQQCADAYARRRADVLVLSPGAADLLDALRRRGCKLGIVTNGFAATHHEKIARLGITDAVDAIFLADEVGMVKPDPELFRHACRTLGSLPERSAMVGDRYDRDVAGAQEAGLFTVLVDVHRIPIRPGARPPDAVVPAIADVLAVLPLAPEDEAST